MSTFDPTEHGWARTGADHIERDGYRIVKSGVSTGPLSNPTHGPIYHAYAPVGAFIAAGGCLKNVCEICLRHEKAR
ncbi:hypothetical protein [Denitromonas iodatirespirans]|uniref:Uncharacterized protein n=1 Tax=Denitromonas iodatirespirans TaxID=2795389 RepID=A0A944DAB7_DENI1|nr:hypothetical protein [Denitromonas iodatirespirans]MBT0961662.1 hypothetical protein [Denitromonas iodatirespirans]